MEAGADAQAAFRRGFGGPVQHWLRDVRERHVVAETCQKQAGVSGAGSDIEYLRAVRQVEGFNG